MLSISSNRPFGSLLNVFHSLILTPKGPRHFLAQKTLKTAMSAAFIQETKKYTFKKI